MRTRIASITVAIVVVAAAALSACTPRTGGPNPVPKPPPPSAGRACNNGQPRPARYQHVVVFSFENRTLSSVGGTGFSGVPYFGSLVKQGCTVFSSYTEGITSQNSATQYVSTAQGDNNHTVRNDCQPSASCQSTADNIFRQVRAAGLTARSYVEGATKTCSAAGNAAKHIPELYFRGGNDPSFCNTEVLPYSRFDVNNLPSFAFVTPTLRNDGHDAGNPTVSAWAQSNVQRVLDSAAYKAGTVLVQIWYDEDHPVPNLFVAPTAKPGPIATPVGYASSTRLWEEALGLPARLGVAPGATNIRPLANI